MTGHVAFEFAPLAGNAISLVVLYGAFWLINGVIAVFYLRRWNVPFFTSLSIFMFLLLLGSIAYLKLHYAPVTGRWYSL